MVEPLLRKVWVSDYAKLGGGPVSRTRLPIVKRKQSHKSRDVMRVKTQLPALQDLSIILMSFFN